MKIGDLVDTTQFRLPQERRLVTELPGPLSRALAERRQAAVARGVASSHPFYVADGDGGVLVDVDGNSVIDLGAGIAVTSVGNSSPRVVEAVREAVGHFTHTSMMVAPYEGYVELSERLNSMTPGGFGKKTVLFNSGSEAVENAVKVARKATGRHAVLAFDHAYHGRTNLTLALTAKNLPYKDGFGPFASEIYRAPMSYPFREASRLTGQEAAKRAILMAEKQIGTNNLAAVIIEPIQGEGGFIVPAEGFLSTLVEWCNSNGIVFIADEVQTGFCRTGKWFASEWDGIEPDLVTTAKGLGGGLPISAVTGRAELIDAVHPGGLGGTYSGNPIACAAALATIETMADWDLCARALAIEDQVRSQLGPLTGGSSPVGEIRGRGAMMAIEFVQPGGIEPDPSASAAVQQYCARAGVLVLTCGTYGNVVRLLPPLTIPADLLEEGLGVLREAIDSL